jgi:TRAP-type uncharacterized transport system substrate-binding protein
MKKIISSISAFLVLFAFSGSIAKSAEFFTIGTGGPTGVYFQTGNAICKMLHKSAISADHGRKKGTAKAYRCTAPSTGGSNYNIGQIKDGEFQFGVAQSDWQFHAYNGSSKWEGNQFSNLRAVFSVHNEPLFQVKALCDGKIDAFGYSVGFPNGAMEQAATCKAKASPINLTGSPVQGLIDGADYYAKAVIPKGTYSNQKKDATTFGVKATVVTSADVSEELVYLVTKAVMENFDDFKAQHPAFSFLKKEDMIKAGLSAPLHPGAIKYYKEAGLM